MHSACLNSQSYSFIDLIPLPPRVSIMHSPLSSHHLPLSTSGTSHDQDALLYFSMPTIAVALTYRAWHHE
jgi:hypothetical protein